MNNEVIAIPQSRVGKHFFTFAALILALQLVTGLLAAAQFIWPALLFEIIPFNIVRMLHINTLVVSLLAGFMGGTYFLIAEEGGGALHSESAARCCSSSTSGAPSPNAPAGTTSRACWSSVSARWRSSTSSG